ncbi:MAG: quinolinate synthase NadA [Candidatus Thermoplasmatota archaeon]|nr:quinolinate synthase NadA [Candidatus Thermoplasmatota archaeon]MCL5963914.1 quinolinate synthase NadA [Candidatus Thermoplasmatota archaeon]
MIGDMVSEIKKLKMEKEAVVLAHNYQIGAVQDLADFVGDSLGLSYEARKTDKKMIVFCGVDFMAETAKIINPDKIVLLPNKYAQCPMAAMIDANSLTLFKKEHPDAAVVSYVNTTAEVKALSDVCCTSANAIKIVKEIPQEEVIFVPDVNLALYVQRFVKNKKIYPWPGYCYTHKGIKPDVIKELRNGYPDAPVVVHPECTPELIDIADKVSSTEGMIKYCRENDSHTFIIATETGMIHRLKKEIPDKDFIEIPNAICAAQKHVRLEDLYRSLVEEIYEVKIPDEIIDKARIPIDRMLEIGRGE